MTDAFKKQLKDILFIDTETVAQQAEFDSVDERLQKQWELKAAYFKNEEKLTAAELYKKRAGIYAEFGKIVCISFGGFYEEEGEMKFKASSVCGDDEKDLLSDFLNILKKHRAKDQLILCAHNGKEFDYPYICRRLLVNGFTLPSILQLAGKKAWNIPHLDTLEMWKFGDYKHFTSLELLATLFDVPSSKNEIDGSMVNDTYHVECNLPKITRYCVADVVVLAQLYLKMNALEAIPDEKIQVVHV